MSYSKFFLTLLFFYFAFNSVSFSQNEADTLYNTETIEVEALRGVERFTPITFENIGREEIEQKYFMQDLPMFLNGSTSILSYSESGGAIGYSYLTLRGFDQRRVSFLVNGIPQNDPEDHQVYWVDLSDITASVENIQIQRGIGTALYGASAIGGVINIQTVDFFKRKFFNVTGGYGDFNSRRYALEYSSGFIPGGFGFYGKFSRIKSDGYRNQSWSNFWSYFLSAGKSFGNDAVLKLNFYGGPIRNHLAYFGVDKALLDGEVTGDKRVDRRYNYLTYPDETDNYNQPHYEAVFNWQPSGNFFISNTFSYIRGDGHFNSLFPVWYGYDFDYFRLQPFFVSDTTTFNPDYYRRNPDGSFYFDPANGYEIVRSDMVTKLTVNNDTYGWFPKLQFTHNNDRGTLLIGGEMRFHKSEHFGEVTFGEALPRGTGPNHVYYFYNGKKQTYSVYANELFKLTPRLTGMLGLQYAFHRYELSYDRFKPYLFDVNYNFFTPRIGLNYNFNRMFSAYANFSMANKEPRLKDIYDAESPYSTPNFRVIDPARGIYEDPLVKPEEMFDYEAGIGFNSDQLNASLNFYLMDFKNEIVRNGQLDNVGQPIAGNAGKSVHRGVEFNFTLKPFSNYRLNPLNGFSVSGNLNFSDNYFKEYRVIEGVDDEGNIIYGDDYSGNRILLTPEIIGNLSLNYNWNNGVGGFISMQHVGKQYLDNSENERKNPERKDAPGYVDKIIEPFTVVNAGLSFDLIPLFNLKNFNRYMNRFEISAKANNLFDVLYETTGNIDSGIPYWIPAATRNFFVEVKIGF